MSAEEDAYQAALGVVAKAREAGATLVYFDMPVCHALTRIPPELADLPLLKQVDLGGTQITDLAPLAALTSLQALRLNNTQITEIAPLAALTGLRTLALSGTQITDLAPLTTLTKLRSLWLEGTEITNLSPIATLTGLLTLALNETQITDLAPLIALTKLQVLWLQGVQITDLGPLAILNRLQILWLQGTQITDLRPILNLPFKLEGRRSGLHFADTPATAQDAELASLSGIEDNEKRTRDTLAYLKTLPPWPQPYTPRARPDGKPPQPIGVMQSMSRLGCAQSRQSRAARSRSEPRRPR